jgi:hypothetical protein
MASIVQYDLHQCMYIVPWTARFLSMSSMQFSGIVCPSTTVVVVSMTYDHNHWGGCSCCGGWWLLLLLSNTQSNRWGREG